MSKQELIGKKFKVYNGGKLEDIGTVTYVETFNPEWGEAYCSVKFDDGTKWNRWIKFENEVK